MEPEGSVLRLQEPATYAYSEPDQSGPCPPIPLSEDPFQYYPLIYAVSSKWPLSPRLPLQNPVCISPLPLHTCYIPCPSHSS